MTDPAPDPTQADDAADLLAWSTRRDEAAFARVVRRHAALVTGTCQRRLPGALADDAAQAVFIVLARRAGGLSEADRLGAWLHGVAVRVCSEARRGAGRRARHERPSSGSEPPAPPVDESAWDDLRPHLDDAIAALSAAQREVVIGHFLEGLTQSAVAARLGISEDAAHQRLHYAIGKLRSWFGKRGLRITGAVLLAGLAGESRAAESALVESCTHAALHPASVPAAAALAGAAHLGGSLLPAAALGAALALAGAAVAWASSHQRPAVPVAAASVPLLAEDFEHGLGRDWYDNRALSIVETAPGSHAAEFRFPPGASVPASGGTTRRAFAEAEAVRIAYRIRYSPEWRTAERGRPLVQCLVMTNADGRFAVPSQSHLTCSIGIDGTTPFVSLQDALNLDAARIGADLSLITEQRAVAGGNALPLPGAEGGAFRRDGGGFGNVMRFPVPGGGALGDWQHVEVRLRLNRIVDGKAVADGRVEYLLDGRPVLGRSDVLFRTAQHPGMRFNQFIMGPWLDGSPTERAFWIDDLSVSADPDATAP